MFDIESNRNQRKWSNQELLGRCLWALVTPLFTYSPKVCWRWRVFLLRCFGANVASNVRLHPSVQIFIPWNLSIGDWSSVGFDTLIYNLGYVTIGTRVTISQRAHLCGGSHDFRDAAMQLLKTPITIGDDAWICADAFVGPNVSVGNQCVVGARACVMRSVSERSIVAGNPARVIGTR